MTIDEAINIAKSDIKYNKSIGCDTSYEEQLTEWLEELKAIKINGFTDDLLNMGFTKGYNKAIDDFVEHITLPITTEEQISEIVEQLKKEN